MKIRLRWMQVVVQQIILSLMTGDLFSAKAATKAANISSIQANKIFKVFQIFPNASSMTCLKLFSPGLTMPNSRLALSGESLACAALTMMVEPNSRRMEPGGALDGSV